MQNMKRATNWATAAVRRSIPKRFAPGIRRALALVLLLTFGWATVAAQAKEDASMAAEKRDTTGAFRKWHEGVLERGRSGPVDLLFLGDSITAGWAKVPHIWEHYYGRDQAANFGIGGDRTQHVIWRIENGELDDISPKVTVLMLGTNNSGSHTAAEISEALKKIVGLIRMKIPGTKVLLLAIFPRGARREPDGSIDPAQAAKAAERMQVINLVNAELARLDDGQQVRFLDINAVFLGQDGRIPFSIMRDQLHPGAAGYQLWAEAMEPLLREMLR